MTSSSLGRILVIDDERGVRDFLAQTLSERGYRVDAVQSGDEGLALFRNTRPDLVICDLHLAHQESLDVLRAINAETPELPIIVTSGQGSMDDVVTALRNGAVDFLLKPVTEFSVLEHAVKRAVEHGQLRRQNRQIREQLERTNAELAHSLARLEEDQEAGRRVQQSLLPKTPHVFNEVFHCSHRVFPSLYLSGDFVDYFRMGPDRIGFYLADVSGHGASSAFVTVFLKTLTNRLQRHYEKRMSAGTVAPSRLMRDINQELISMAMGKHLAMFCGVVDLAENKLTYCMGAHFPPPILVNDGVAQALPGRGLPVGIFSDASFDEVVMPLGRRFSLVLMSDGILEVLPQPTMEEKQAHLLAVVSQHHDNADVLAQAFNVKEGIELPDDIALLVINRSE